MSTGDLPTLRVGSQPCGCGQATHGTKLVALTGGPGAGKTAVLELAARTFCKHVAILPEAASIVFGGGFPRHSTLPGRRAAQVTIYHVQRGIERLVVEEGQAAIALCDRGTPDGGAYWPDGLEDYWHQLESTEQAELSRYAAVIHLGTPSLLSGYGQNPLRVESADEAARLDRKVSEAWRGHSRRFSVSSRTDFLSKAVTALELIRAELPKCCNSHLLPGEEGSVAANGAGG